MKTDAISPIEAEISESTISAVVIGLVLAVVMGAANVYLGLYAGMTVSASIPAAVISMAIMKGIFRRGTILENNISQTLASTGETLAAGAIFTIPALVLSGAWETFHYWETTLIIMLGGTLGVVFMVPLRRALIVDRPDLTYPEGVACSKVLIAGHEGGAGVKWIGFGLALGAVFKYLVSSLGLVVTTVQGAVAAGRSVLYAGTDMSLALVSVGYIVNFRVAMQVFAGGAMAWVVAIPLLGGYTGEVTPVDYAEALWREQVRYIGVGCMLVGGIYSIWSVRTGVLGALGTLRGVSGSASGAAAVRTERDMSMMSLAVLLMVAVVATAALYDVLIGSLGVALAATVIMVAASFIFAAVATYICGLVGSSNSPVSGMTICALLIAAGVLMVLGVKGDSAILATLGVAGVVCCATCAAGDMAQDLKTGQLVGSTPAAQQRMQVLSVIVTAFVFAPVMTLLHHHYGIGDQLRAPQATLFASLAQGFFDEDGHLPWSMVAIGAGIGVAIIALDSALARAGSTFRAHIMPIAVGIYLPFSLSAPIFIGGIIRALVSRTSDDASDRGVLFGSGMIAGEALMGIGLAVVLTISEIYGLETITLSGNAPISLALFALCISGFALAARRQKR